jgi:Ca-activated chloride channel family protein
MVSAALVAAVVAAVAALAEWLHARRTRRMSRLAFGAGGARRWTAAAPALRVAGVAATVFGALTLLHFDPLPSLQPRSARASKQLLICLDVSPSMSIRDAGIDMPRVSRAKWVGTALRPLIDAVDTTLDTRITVVAFYDKALPVLIDTQDKNVVANLLDGLQLDLAFQRGSHTNLEAGVNGALELAKPWAVDSTTLVIVSDGDSQAGLASLRPRPPSISQVIVAGVGDASAVSEINGHGSRQDSGSLRRLATRLRGSYHDCNRTILPASATTRLSMRAPAGLADATERSIGLAALGIGGALAGLTGPLLLAFGRRRQRAGADHETKPGTDLSGARGALAGHIPWSTSRRTSA